MIYFIRSPINGLVKIGYTSGAVRERLRRLRATCPVQLDPIAVMDGGETDEGELHARFLADWSHGEWFRLSAQIEAFMAREATPWSEEFAGFRAPRVTTTSEQRLAARAEVQAREVARVAARREEDEEAAYFAVHGPAIRLAVEEERADRILGSRSFKDERKDEVDAGVAYTRAREEHREYLQVLRES